MTLRHGPVERLPGIEGISRNLLRNSMFRDWSRGTTTPPDVWTTPNAALAAREATIKLVGDYALRIEGAGAYRSVEQALPLSDLAYYQGRELTLGCWVRTAVAVSGAFISIDDGVVETDSDPHSGGGGWEFLTVRQTIDGAATRVEALMRVGAALTGGNYSYFDTPMMVDGPISMRFGFHPLDAFRMPRSFVPLHFLGSAGVGNSAALTNTTGNVGWTHLPLPMKVRYITYRSMVAGTADAVVRVAIYSEDGNDKLIDVTDAIGTATGARTIDLGAGNEVLLWPGAYYVFCCLSSGTTGPQLRFWSISDSALRQANGGEDGVMEGTLVIVGGAAPASFDPTADITSATLHHLRVKLTSIHN